MNIIVCVKQVPGTTKVSINPETNTLMRQGIENIINPFDTYALEEGYASKSATGARSPSAASGRLKPKQCSAKQSVAAPMRLSW